MRGLRFLPLGAVLTVIGVYIAVYAAGQPPRQFVTWPAINNYISQDLPRAQLQFNCDLNSLDCAVTWQSSAGGAATDVYRCDDMAAVRRDEVVGVFFVNVRTAASEGEARRSAAVLDGFFQSGLRRICDRAVRRARDRASLAPSLVPLELGSLTPGSTAQRVTGVDEGFVTVPTGLARRPEYRGDVLAAAGWLDSGAVATPTAVRLTTADRRVTTALLNPTQLRGCGSIWPGGAASADCSAAQIHLCDPARGGPCAAPVAEMYALNTGGVVIRIARTAAANTLAPNLEALGEDELVSASGKADEINRLYVVGTGALPGFFMEVLPGGTVPVSRLRLVNGRWQRWTDPGVRAWIEPVVGDYERLAADDLIDASQPISLALNIALQRDLEESLTQWMQRNVERQVLGDLRRHFGSASRSLGPFRTEDTHRRAVPQAGVTVLDANTGAIAAVASYPPAAALEYVDGEPSFAPGWQSRLVGTGAPPWAIREVLEALDDRINGDTNANFSVHPIGSSFKPVLLSLFADRQLPSGQTDDLERLFDLVIAGHAGEDGIRNGGDAAIPCQCGGIGASSCTLRDAEAIAGLPLGPWGNEEAGARHVGAWIDRREFLIGSCNKYAVTLGVLSLLDWTRRGNASTCCWNTPRDQFGFRRNTAASTVPPAVADRVSRPQDLPDLGPGLRLLNNRVATNASFADAPVFVRLQEYYGVSPRTFASPNDSTPWASCLAGPNAARAAGESIGRVNRTQLTLTSFPVGVPFSNIFTGSGRNWWSNVKIAEAYSRLALNQRTVASFCAPVTPAAQRLFTDTSRHEDMVRILSQQRQASWVETDQIDRWQGVDPRRRMTLSKTGTSLRQEQNESTGIFAIFMGEVAAVDPVAPTVPTRAQRGLVVAAHVDDVGGSGPVTALVDGLFHLFRDRAAR